MKKLCCYSFSAFLFAMNCDGLEPAVPEYSPAQSAVIRVMACEGNMLNGEEASAIQMMVESAVQSEEHGYHEFMGEHASVNIAGAPIAGYTPYLGMLPGVAFFFEDVSGAEATRIVQEVARQSRVTGEGCDFNDSDAEQYCEQSFDVNPSDDNGAFLGAYDPHADILLLGCGYDYQI